MTTTIRYLKVCPRGFANEVVYFRVPLSAVAEAEAEFAGYEDKEPGRYAQWTKDRRAHMPGVAFEWADRRAVL